jgi:hypothetical protein
LKVASLRRSDRQQGRNTLTPKLASIRATRDFANLSFFWCDFDCGEGQYLAGLWFDSQPAA